MCNNKSLQSDVITFLRFPLIVAVVFIHSNFNDVVIAGADINASASHFSLYENLRYLLSILIAEVAVPLFFFISGFLFFIKTECLTLKTYLQKIKKRGMTLLFPYIFWNLVVILLFYLAQTFFKGLISGNNIAIADYTWRNWLNAFWGGNTVGENYPINFPLWFIRDLMVVIVFSPLIYRFVKTCKQYAVVILGVLWIFDLWIKVDGFSITAFFFFTFGAYWGIYKKNIVDSFSKIFPHSAWIYMFLIACDFLFKDYSWRTYIHKTDILVGIGVFIALSGFLIKKQVCHSSPKLADSSFFIYVYHGMPLAFVIKVLSKFVQPQSDICFTLLYLLCPVFIILIGLIIYKLIIRYFPRFTSLILGGR